MSNNSHSLRNRLAFIGLLLTILWTLVQLNDRFNILSTFCNRIFVFISLVNEALNKTVPIWSLIISFGIAFITYYYYNYYPIKNKIKQRNLKIIDKVIFDYLPDSPSNHCWIVKSDDPQNPNSKIPEFSKEITQKFGPVLKIIPFGRYYMDYNVTWAHSICKNVEFIVIPDEGCIIYLRIEIIKENLEPRKVWLALIRGNNKPKQFNNIEWWVYLEPKKLDNDWFLFLANIPSLVQDTYGNDGWKYHRLIAFRLRGKMSIAQILLLK